MKIGKKPVTDAKTGQGFDITKDNYVDRACSFIKIRGSGVVIRAIEGSHGEAATRLTATEAQWIAWMDYFDEKGIMNHFAKDLGMTTVPCEWPWEFDGAYPKVADKAARLTRRPAQRETEEHRDRVCGLIKRLADGLGFPTEKRRQDFDKRRLAPPCEPDAETIERWKSPVTLSNTAIEPKASRKPWWSDKED